MRSADAVEKASRASPSLLWPYKAQLLGQVAAIEQQEVKWHLLQMLPRLDLSKSEREAAFLLAEHALRHESRIVQAEALSSLFGLADADPDLNERARGFATRAAASGTPALRARARKLLG